MPLDKWKSRLIDGNGNFRGVKCDLCGFEIHVMAGGWLAMTAYSGMTSHIKSKHPKEYESWAGHPPIWRYKDWEEVMEIDDDGVAHWKWAKKSES